MVVGGAPLELFAVVVPNPTLFGIFDVGGFFFHILRPLKVVLSTFRFPLSSFYFFSVLPLFFRSHHMPFLVRYVLALGGFAFVCVWVWGILGFRGVLWAYSGRVGFFLAFSMSGFWGIFGRFGRGGSFCSFLYFSVVFRFLSSYFLLLF